MPKSTPSLAELLRASAQSRRYPFLERAAFWEERLAMHLKDLETLLDAPVDGDMLPLPAKAKLEIALPRGGEPPGRSDDLCFASAAEIAARVRTRELSPFEVARAFVERADAHRSLHAFITLRPETVLREARQLEVRVQSGEDIGPLAGVPVAVKDLMPVAGYPMTCGTKAIEAQEQQHDAEVVARLRAAGALVMGTANLHELAYGVTSANVHFGSVGNPVAPGRIPGGSSGGSAVAVAAGLAAIGVGTDTGGSIRIPAACCGIVGFKGSYDAVTRQGVWPLAFTLDHIGPLARSVADAALGFEVMAGTAGRLHQREAGRSAAADAAGQLLLRSRRGRRSRSRRRRHRPLSAARGAGRRAHDRGHRSGAGGAVHHPQHRGLPGQLGAAHDPARGHLPRTCACGWRWDSSSAASTM